MHPPLFPRHRALWSLCAMLCLSLAPCTAQQFTPSSSLSSLSLTPGELSPRLFRGEETSYSFLLAPGASSVTVVFTAAALASTSVGINAGPLLPRTSGVGFVVGVPNEGLTTMILSVLSPSGARTIYRVLIVRPPLVSSSNALLTGVVFVPGSLSPGKWSSRTLVYNLTLPLGYAGALSVEARAAEGNSYIQLIVGTDNPRTIRNYSPFVATVSSTTRVIKVNCIAQSGRVSVTYTFNIVRSQPLGVDEGDETGSEASSTAPAAEGTGTGAQTETSSTATTGGATTAGGSGSGDAGDAAIGGTGPVSQDSSATTLAVARPLLVALCAGAGAVALQLAAL